MSAESRSGGERVISLHDVWYSYNGRPALGGVTFHVEQGSFVALIGPNGAGKTTSLRLLLGLLRPDRGSVSVFGHDPIRQPEPIGYVPQRVEIPHGFPLSVLEVVLMGRYGRLGPGRRPGSADRDKAREALNTVGLGHLTERRYEDLSGGQQQRALIARGLATVPRLLILVEPPAGLVPAARARFYTLVCELQRSRGLTLLCATHDIEEVAEHAWRVILLEHTVLADGPPGEVMSSEALRQSYGFPPPHVHPPIEDREEAGTE